MLGLETTAADLKLIAEPDEDKNYGTYRRRRPSAHQADRDRADLHLRHRPEALERHPDRGRVSADIRVKDLSEDDVRKISRVIEEQGRVEGDLRKEISMNIKRLMEIGS